ncbi:patatin-domain-containing protein, partial [Suhomyces tanzawaensis NRRL Y-17324]
LKSIPLLNKFLPGKDEKQLLIESLLEQQRKCTSYKNWYQISLKLDELLNNNSWKSNPESDLYDHNLIFKNLSEMRNARLANDYKLLLYVIRTKWIRNLGNMGDINLYRHSYVGTKRLIEEYINECQTSLDYLINDPRVNLEDSYLLGMLIQTRRNIGRTALVLSGGSTFGIFHIGVLITLLEANLLPRIISGSSAGSIVASILCCHTNEETPELLSGLTQKTFNIFGEEEPDSDGDQALCSHSKFKRLLNNLSHLIKYGTLFDMSGLKNTMIEFIGDLTFREAYNRTGKILNITVSPASIHEQTRLLNYLTAPNCLIWSAVCASCSLPGFFPSNSIYEKTPRTNEVHEWNNDASMKYVDGSVDNDLPITRLSEMFNVDNIIAVQVNPHVVPILKVSVGNIGGEIENHLSSRFKGFLNNVYDFMSCEVIHYLQLLNEMDIYKNLSNKLISILSQNYSGDITILADFKPSDFAKVFDNPTSEFLLEFIVRGARASWPKVTVINNYCGVEFALDKAISLLRGRLITSVRHTSKHKKSVSGDKLITFKEDKNIHTLVSSPVLSNETGEFESTPENFNKTPPAFKRHSTSSDIFKKKNLQAAGNISQSNTWHQGFNKTKKKFTKGKSTTSLASLGVPIQSPASDDSTLLNDDDHKEEHFVRSNSMDQKKYGRRNIKKAKSSSNFLGNDISKSGSKSPMKVKIQRFQSERVPSHIVNPYLESMPLPDSPKKICNVENKDKANFPKLSANNSNRNSFVGLSRLKENDFVSKSS